MALSSNARLQLRIELAINNVWVDVSDRLIKQPVRISRGRPDETGHAPPASVQFALRNLDGALTPYNPNSPYYPHIRRNIPARVTVVDVPGVTGHSTLVLPATVGANAITPDDPALHITGDIDIRAHVAPDAWASGSTQTLVARWLSSGDNRSWRFLLTTDGRLGLQWTTDGSLGGGQFRQSEPLGFPPGELRGVRVTLDVDDNGDNTVTFYRSFDGATWDPVGLPETQPGTTSINTGTASLEVGSDNAGAFSLFAGRIAAVEVRDGIDGPAVADPNFTAQPAGTTELQDAAGRTWTINAPAAITSELVRLVPLVSEWAPYWPTKSLPAGSSEGQEPEAHVTVTASGIMRRLTQGPKPLPSSLRRRIMDWAPGGLNYFPPGDLPAYWPCEDQAGATAAASPLAGVSPMSFPGEWRFAGDDSLAASLPLPTLANGQGGGFTAPVPPPAPGSMAWSVDWVHRLPTLAAGVGTTMLMQIELGGGSPINAWRVRAGTGGLVIEWRAGEDWTTHGTFDSSGMFDPDADYWTLFRFEAVQQGDGVEWAFWTIPLNRSGLGSVIDDSYVGQPGHVTRIGSLLVAPPDGITVGHIAVTSFIPLGWLALAETAHAGEPAAIRIPRLCSENAVLVQVIGDPPASEPMGPQRAATLPELLQECADADMGILTDPKDFPGILYRTRTSLYNQPPRLQLDAADKGTTPPFDPTLDDQHITNDVTAQRASGSSYRAVDEDSIEAEGRYDINPTINVDTDAQLPPWAGWRLHLGTWPELRYPKITSELTATPDGTIGSWVDLEPGDRLTVTGLPPQHPGDVDQLAQGYAETISPGRWAVEANTTPQGPWQVGALGDDQDLDLALPRLATGYSVLAAAIDDTEPGLDVVTIGPRWISGDEEPWEADHLPVDIIIAGEEMTATAIGAPAEALDPTALVEDDFDRSISGSWGTTSSGDTWDELDLNPADITRTVGGGQGNVTFHDDGSVAYSAAGPAAGDQDVLAAVSVDQIAAGASLVAAVLARTDLSPFWFYTIFVSFQTDGSLTLTLGAAGPGGGANLTTEPTGLTYSPNDVFWLRARVNEGHRVRGRIWPDGDPEPGTWLLDETITDPGLQNTNGQAGVFAGADIGVTNTDPTVSFHHIEAHQVAAQQAFTVVRSINGIAKEHPTGTPVQVADPFRLAL